MNVFHSKSLGTFIKCDRDWWIHGTNVACAKHADGADGDFDAVQTSCDKEIGFWDDLLRYSRRGPPEVAITLKISINDLNLDVVELTLCELLCCFCWVFVPNRTCKQYIVYI